MTSLIYTPQVRDGLRDILFEGCNWFPGDGDLKLFAKAVDLLAIAKGSERSDAEINEMYNQLYSHMKRAGFHLDIGLISFAVIFLGTLKSQNGQKVKRGELLLSIEECLKKVPWSHESPSLLHIFRIQKIPTSDPCSPLSQFASKYLQRLAKKPEDKQHDLTVVIKLLWIQSHHCGVPLNWANYIHHFNEMSFQPPLADSLCHMHLFFDSASFHSLGLFIQSSLECSCDFIEDMCRRAGYEVGQRSIIKIDPAASQAITSEWIRKVFLRCIPEELCARAILCLNSLHFYRNGKQLKLTLFSSFAASFCKTDLSRLGFMMDCIDVEHSYYSISREVVKKMLISSMSSYDYCSETSYMKRNQQRPSINLSVLAEVLTTNTLGNLFGSAQLFASLRDYIPRNMNWSERRTVEGNIRVLGALYEKLAYAAEVEHNEIQSFIINTLESGIGSRRAKCCMIEGIFTVATELERIFIPFQGMDCRQKIATLVIEKYITSEVSRNPDCLLKLPLSHRNEDTLLSCLMSHLTATLCKHLHDFEHATLVYCELRGKGASESLIRLLNNVFLSAIKAWSPKGVLEIFQLSCLSRLNDGMMTGELRGAIGTKFQGLQPLLKGWTKSSHPGPEALMLKDIEDVLHIYDCEKWHSIEDLTGEDLIDASTLDDILSQFDGLVSTINNHLCLTESQTMLDILRRYECHVQDAAGVANLLTKCNMIVDPSYRCEVVQMYSIASIQHISNQISAFRRDYGSHFETASYFLGVDCQLFSQSIEFGSWDDIQIEKFMGKVSSASASLQSLLSCKGATGLLSTVSSMVAMFPENCGSDLLDSAFIKNEISLLVACPSFKIDKICGDRFCLLSSLINVTKPLKSFVDWSKQIRFQFAHEDQSFGELEKISQKLQIHLYDDSTEFTFQDYQRLAESMIVILRASEDEDMETEELAFAVDQYASFMNIFEALALASEVWIFVKEMHWFGKEGLRQFYTEFSNTTNKLLFAPFESSVLDSLDPIVRFLSLVGSLHNVSKVCTFCESMKTFEYDSFSRNQREDSLQVVQQNITNIREWFDNGFDDMQAIFSRFVYVWESGKFMVKDSKLCLSYCNEEEEDFLTGPKLDEFAQQLGFVQHENKSVSDKIALFLDQLQIVRKVVTSLNQVISQGYRTVEVLDHLTDVNQDLKAAKEILHESEQLVTESIAWRNKLREKYPISTLFATCDHRLLYSAISADDKELGIIILMLSVMIPSKDLDSLQTSVLFGARVCLDLMAKNEKGTWVDIVFKFLSDFHEQVNSIRFCEDAKAIQNGITRHIIHVEDTLEDFVFLFVITNAYNVSYPKENHLSLTRPLRRKAYLFSFAFWLDRTVCPKASKFLMEHLPRRWKN